MRDNRKEQVHILPVPDPNSNVICPDPEFITSFPLFSLHSVCAWRAISDRGSTFNADEGTTEKSFHEEVEESARRPGVEIKDYRQIRRHWAGMERV
jgi:hypothetical protein